MEFRPAQDENIYPTPFTFRPFHLASLVDPKSLESLEGMGRINSLLASLGVNSTNGLRTSGREPKSRDARAPATFVTTTVGEKGVTQAEDATYTSTVRGQQRAYGSNILPAPFSGYPRQQP